METDFEQIINCPELFMPDSPIARILEKPRKESASPSNI